MPEHFEVIIRTIVAFSLLLVGACFLGKQTISQMTIFDFIAAITLGAITAAFAYNTTLKPHTLIISFIIFVCVIYLIAVISMKSRKLRKIFAGDPTVVIQNGKILESNMRKMRYTIDYLNQQLREKDVFHIVEVQFAILETNGTLTVLKKPQYRNVTRQDLMLITTPDARLPIELIMDGEIITKNLKENKLTKVWLYTELQTKHLDVKEVFYAVLLANGTLYIDTYKDILFSPIDKE